MVFFFNGKIGFGSPCAGRTYWMPLRLHDEQFISGAKTFCLDSQALFPEIDFTRLSRTPDRISRGYQWSQDQLNQDTFEAPLHFIGHSMGCAFAEGAIQGFKEAGFSIGKVIHINCFQASTLSILTEERSFTIDYQMTDDPLINNPLLRLLGIAKPGTIGGADYVIKENSGIRNPFYRHRAPMGLWGQYFWEHLAATINKGSLNESREESL